MKGWMVRHKSGLAGVKDAHDWHPESLSFLSESESWDCWFLDNPLEEKAEHECFEVEVREADPDPKF